MLSFCSRASRRQVSKKGLHPRRLLSSSHCFQQQKLKDQKQSLRDAVHVHPSSDLPKPRLDYKSISSNVVFKSHNAFNRKSSTPVGAIQSVARLYAELKVLSSLLDGKRHQRSLVGDEIRSAIGGEKLKKLEEAKRLKKEIQEMEDKVDEMRDEMLAFALTIPNDTHPETPIGSEACATTLKISGPEPLPARNERDHVSLNSSLSPNPTHRLFDFEAGATVTGSSWYYLLNEGALLENALTQYALHKAVQKGFRPVMTPDVVKADVASRCGFQPRDNADPPVHQMYHLNLGNGKGHPELVLSGTAEIPLGGLFANKVVPLEDLPAKVVGLGRAFRAEAGASGADTRGLYRVHQFSKVELFVVCEASQSEEMMKEVVDLQVEIFEGLGLSIRLLDMPTEELGASAYRKMDIEAWMPGRGKWGEISSTSNCTDYQARRLHIRHTRPASSDDHTPLPFAHTLNGTAAAIPRLIVALLENGARFEGDKVVGLDLPGVLKPYWLGDGIINIRWI